MSRIGNGLLVGLAATVVLSGLMVMKTVMGVMPELDLPNSSSAQYSGGPTSS